MSTILPPSKILELSERDRERERQKGNRDSIEALSFEGLPKSYLSFRFELIRRQSLLGLVWPRIPAKRKLHFTTLKFSNFQIETLNQKSA